MVESFFDSVEALAQRLQLHLCPVEIPRAESEHSAEQETARTVEGAADQGGSDTCQEEHAVVPWGSATKPAAWMVTNLASIPHCSASVVIQWEPDRCGG